MKYLILSLPQIVSALLALATVKVYTSILTPQQIGCVMLAVGIIALIDAILISPFAQALFYKASQGNALSIYGEILIKANGRRIMLEVLLSGILTAIYLFLPFSQLKCSLIVVFFLISYLLIEIQRVAYLTLLNVDKKNLELGACIIIESLFTFILTITFLKYFDHWTSLLTGIVCGKVCALFSSAYLARNWLNNLALSSQMVSGDTTRGLASHSIPFIWMGALGWSAAFLDRYIIASVTSVAEAGVYAIILGLIARPYSLLDTCLTLFFKPDLFKKAFSKERFINLRWIMTSIVLGLTGVISFIVLGPYIIPFFINSDYQGLSLAVLFLSFASFITLLIHAFDNELLAYGFSGDLLLIQIVAIPIGIGFVITGAYLWGMNGVAIGKCCGAFVLLILTVNIGNRRKKYA